MSPTVAGNVAHADVGLQTFPSAAFPVKLRLDKQHFGFFQRRYIRSAFTNS